MPLGAESKRQLATCRPELQRLIMAAVVGVDRGDLHYAGVLDLMVTCGFRNQEDQEEAYDSGASHDHWPLSHHNRTPSDAVDVVPYPERWSDKAKLIALHAYIAGLARAMGIPLRGISWDLPHIEWAGS